MLDRMREALFNTLSPWTNGARVLDLFAGSGSLGLEALSRGATSARMIDRGAEALVALRSNVELLRVGDRAEVVRGDAFEPALWGVTDAERYDIVFLDPPYPSVADPAGRVLLIERVEQLVADALVSDGVLVLHAEKRRARELAEADPEWELRVYGSSALLYMEGRTA
jgi:16S rRNA (guanine966-N2)-methyltransferase